MNYESTIDSSGRDSAALSGSLPDEEDDSKARHRPWLILAAAGVIIVLVWFMLHRGETDGATDKKDQAPSVSYIVPGSTTIQGTISVNGSLAARREMPVGVAGEGGQVRQVLVEAGAWVRAGQVLAVIDRSVQVQQAAGQNAQIQVSEADARLAQANLDRALKLVDRGFISKADVDRLTATRDSANARVRLAKATSGQIGAQIARLNIIAPADGLVLERKVEPGQVVSPGSGVLFRIAKGGEMEMKALVGEVDLAKITQGVTAQVTPVGSQKVFTGQVWQVAPVIDPQTRQGFARIALSYAPELRPGGFATASIISGSVVAPMLPDSAVLNDSQGDYVFVIGKDNRAERRPIKTGLITDKGIAIVSGLSGNERVVLRAGGFLTPAETVNPVAAKK